MADLKLIKKQAQKELEKAENLNELKEIFNKYLGNTTGKINMLNYPITYL
jgi:hypothetical protein